MIRDKIKEQREYWKRQTKPLKERVIDEVRDILIKAFKSGLTEEDIINVMKEAMVQQVHDD